MITSAELDAKRAAQKHTWDDRFMRVAKEVASWSKDRSTKVGSVVVSQARDIKATGFNGFPREINDDVDARHERPAKYKWTEHAERNAIFAAARLGTSMVGCTLYSTLFPCVDCARAMIQAGIMRLVAPAPDFENPNWGADFKLAIEMLAEAGVEVAYYTEPCDIEATREIWLNGPPNLSGSIFGSRYVSDEIRRYESRIPRKVIFDGKVRQLTSDYATEWESGYLGYTVREDERYYLFQLR